MSTISSTQPITILHTRGPASFLELASPGGPSSPTPSSSSSSSSSSASALSPTLSDFVLPPADPWRVAAAEAAMGIHYALEEYPAPGQTVLSPPFRNAPITVRAGARVVLLEDGAPDALHLRVRVLETGDVGHLPAWNVEGALERLARLNMEFNEAATCPAERKPSSRGGRSTPDAFKYETSPSHSHMHAVLAHKHDRCVPFSTRTYPPMSGPPAYEDEDEIDDPFGLVEDGDSTETRYGSQRVRGARRKSVGFAEVRPKVFRYPSAALLEAYYGEATEEEDGFDEREDGEAEQKGTREEDEEWWWAGWEEQKEESNSDVFMDAE